MNDLKKWQGTRLRIVGNAEQWEDNWSLVGKPMKSIRSAQRSAINAVGYDDLLYVLHDGSSIFDIVGHNGRALSAWGDEDFEGVAEGLEMKLARS